MKRALLAGKRRTRRAGSEAATGNHGRGGSGRVPQPSKQVTGAQCSRARCWRRVREARSRRACNLSPSMSGGGAVGGCRQRRQPARPAAPFPSNSCLQQAQGARRARRQFGRNRSGSASLFPSRRQGRHAGRATLRATAGRSAPRGEFERRRRSSSNIFSTLWPTPPAMAS